MSRQSGTWSDQIFANDADHTELNTFTTDASLLGGTNLQPILFPTTLLTDANARKRVFELFASGTLSTTGTPTYTFTVRLGTTAGSSFLSGTTIGASAAITTGSGVSDKRWELYLRFIIRSQGIGTGNETVCSEGWTDSPAGYASPFKYTLTPGGGDGTTWTATIDGSLTQYLNLSVACSASNASNKIKCRNLVVTALQ